MPLIFDAFMEVSQVPKNDQNSPENPEYCEARGYHGPFGRAEVYDRFPGWEGNGECVICGSCRHIATENKRRMAATRDVEDSHSREGKVRRNLSNRRPSRPL